MKEQWIDQMQQKMADFQEPAPEVSWEEIEKAVAGHQQEGKTAPASSKAKAVPMWLRKVAAAALVLLIAGVGYLTAPLSSPEGDTNVPRQALRTPHGEQSGELSEQHQNDEELIPSETPLLAKVRQVVRQAIQAERDTIADAVAQVTPTANGEETAPPSSPEGDTNVPHQALKTQDRPSSSVSQHLPLNAQRSARPEGALATERDARTPNAQNRLTVKLFLSNGMGSSNHTSVSKRSIFVDAFTEDNPDNDPTDSNNNEDPLMSDDTNNSGNTGNNNGDGTNNDDQDNHPNDTRDGNTTQTITTQTVTTTQQVRHHQPIHYGLSLRYRLNKRWGIETGLTYSLLTSDITTKEENTTTQSTQRLNYIGIPLKAEYLIWGSRHFDVYASAGMMVEKMVKGSLENNNKGTKESLSIRPLQFSVSSGLGAEYKYNDLLSIFVEPGIGYYFDNGSTVPTFYQDKPLNFNLNLGLRFQFQGK